VLGNPPPVTELRARKRGRTLPVPNPSVIIRSGPGGVGAPRGPDHEGTYFMARRSVLQDAVPNEVRRTILRESTQRFNHELMDDEERLMLLDRIKRIRRQLRLA
jgi:hypothetical protein